MEIKIAVKPKSSRNRITIENGNLVVHTKEDTKNNLANKSIISQLSIHFQTNERNIRIVKGFQSKNKVVEVIDENIVA